MVGDRTSSTPPLSSSNVPFLVRFLTFCCCIKTERSQIPEAAQTPGSRPLWGRSLSTFQPVLDPRQRARVQLLQMSWRRLIGHNCTVTFDLCVVVEGGKAGKPDLENQSNWENWSDLV